MALLNCLNVGAGDIAITFNHMDEAEAQKAIAMLTDMRDRGYAILVCLEDGSYTRAVDIDAKAGRYIVQIPTEAPLPEGAEELAPRAARRGPRTRRVAVDVTRASATGVARSAGG